VGHAGLSGFNPGESKLRTQSQREELASHGPRAVRNPLLFTKSDITLLTYAALEWSTPWCSQMKHCYLVNKHCTMSDSTNSKQTIFSLRTHKTLLNALCKKLPGFLTMPTSESFSLFNRVRQNLSKCFRQKHEQ